MAKNIYLKYWFNGIIYYFVRKSYKSNKDLNITVSNNIFNGNFYYNIIWIMSFLHCQSINN